MSSVPIDSDVLSLTSTNVPLLVPRKLVVAHTPGIPKRYELLLKHLTYLLCCDNEGKSYVCCSNQRIMFLRWSKADMCLFFEWEEEEEQMICWMHDIANNVCMKFLLNPAIIHGKNFITAKRPAIAFSSDLSNTEVKKRLITIFGSSENEDLLKSDHLFVFTTTGSSLCFRNFKIDSYPELDATGSLVLTEVGPFFSLKLLDSQGDLKQDFDLSQNQIGETLELCSAVYYGSSDCSGSYTPHHVELHGRTFTVLLRNDHKLTLAGQYEGFNASLLDLLSKEPALKRKHIIGSSTSKQHVFIRNRFLSILQSVVLEYVNLFASGSCFASDIKLDNVLIRGHQIKIYGLMVSKYANELAVGNVRQLEFLIRSCFPSTLIPEELEDALNFAVQPVLDGKDPLTCLQALSDDPVWLTPEHRRTLLINHHSEFMTNVNIRDELSDEDALKFKKDFFVACPYIDTWSEITMDNEYLVEVGEDEEIAKEVDGMEDVEEDAIAIKKRSQKKHKMRQASKGVKKRQKRRKDGNKGTIQLNFKRKFLMHMPEKANKDGIIPFRLGLSDRILTSYYPLYLAFIHRKMSSRRKLKKRKK
ncbi:unnamed protein product [Triticum turgidum subsp. durum]|uniref:Uncharacterized protein n=1 Tax=Triticum turgidum subsp. durum TaxID=4567 RepID=A0A9R1BB62_TRITD|nr:unnamed protein product [Triticum turgidum subsp. durum]